MQLSQNEHEGMGSEQCADLEVIDELFFVFIGHVDNDFWLPVDSQGTCLFVLANARMAPIA